MVSMDFNRASEHPLNVELLPTDDYTNNVDVWSAVTYLVSVWVGRCVHFFCASSSSPPNFDRERSSFPAWQEGTLWDDDHDNVGFPRTRASG